MHPDDIQRRKDLAREIFLVLVEDSMTWYDPDAASKVLELTAIAHTWANIFYEYKLTPQET